MTTDWNPQLARAVSPDLSVAPQLLPDQLAQVAAAGFRAVINNRPDFEAGPDQPTGQDIEAAARAAGLAYRHLPVPPSNHTDEQARAMAQAVSSLPKPVLAFCRSGRRSGALYQQGTSLRAD